MDHDIAMRWVAELRSGKHQQGQGYLHRANGQMCCLGVLCAFLATPGQAVLEDNVVAYDQQLTWPPLSICDRAGMHFVEGALQFEINGRQFGTLADANDAGCTFAQIADVIEQRWKEL